MAGSGNVFLVQQNIFLQYVFVNGYLVPMLVTRPIQTYPTVQPASYAPDPKPHHSSEPKAYSPTHQFNPFKILYDVVSHHPRNGQYSLNDFRRLLEEDFTFPAFLNDRVRFEELNDIVLNKVFAGRSKGDAIALADNLVAMIGSALPSHILRNWLLTPVRFLRNSSNFLVVVVYHKNISILETCFKLYNKAFKDQSGNYERVLKNAINEIENFDREIGKFFLLAVKKYAPKEIVTRLFANPLISRFEFNVLKENDPEKNVPEEKVQSPVSKSKLSIEKSKQNPPSLGLTNFPRLFSLVEKEQDLASNSHLYDDISLLGSSFHSLFSSQIVLLSNEERQEARFNRLPSLLIESTEDKHDQPFSPSR